VVRIAQKEGRTVHAEVRKLEEVFGGAVAEVILKDWILDKESRMRLQIVAFIVLTSLLVGCSGQSTPKAQNAAGSPADSFSHVITTEVEYYTTGPQQGRPPDGKFPAGTKVTIVREAGSYILVRSEDGVEAYVASDAIKETEL
jgi:hypothetical protein